MLLDVFALLEVFVFPLFFSSFHFPSLLLPILSSSPLSSRPLPPLGVVRRHGGQETLVESLRIFVNVCPTLPSRRHHLSTLGSPPRLDSPRWAHTFPIAPDWSPDMFHYDTPNLNHRPPGLQVGRCRHAGANAGTNASTDCGTNTCH